MARILVVEDEMLVAMLIEDVLGDLGHQVIGPAMRIETALAVIENQAVDFAILDINIAGKQSFPVADRLKELQVPFIFASGYGFDGLIDKYKEIAILQKPFTPDQLEAALRFLEP
jgi:DNA-binding response OmpR family regulator